MTETLGNLSPRWEHQIRGTQLALADPLGFALFMEMGTGKTRTIIDVLRGLFTQSRRIERTLILCPRIVVENWKEEIAKFSKIPMERVICLIGTPKKRRQLFKDACARWPAGFICITNYDKLARYQEVEGKQVNMSEDFKDICEWEPENIVCDESHKIKDLKAGRTKAVVSLCDRSKRPRLKRVYLMTGTPVLRDPTDLFSQFLVMDNGATFGREFWPFKLRFMVDANAAWKGKPNYFPKWEVKPGAVEQVADLIKARSFRARKSECLSLPPFVQMRRYVEMTPDQRRMYMEMKKDFITFIEDKACVARLAITKAIRLMQISSGFVQTECGSTLSIPDTPKMEALTEILEEICPQNKVIVWAVFKENYVQIRKVFEKLGLKYVEVNGDVQSDGAKFENVKRFQVDPTISGVIAHPGSGGIGVNMTAAAYAVDFSRDFSFGNRNQAKARNYRGGSEIHEKITWIDLVTRGTIEEAILERVGDKEEMAEGVLVGLLRELAKEL